MITAAVSATASYDDDDDDDDDNDASTPIALRVLCGLTGVVAEVGRDGGHETGLCEQVEQRRRQPAAVRRVRLGGGGSGRRLKVGRHRAARVDVTRQHLGTDEHRWAHDRRTRTTSTAGHRRAPLSTRSARTHHVYSWAQTSTAEHTIGAHTPRLHTLHYHCKKLLIKCWNGSNIINRASLPAVMKIYTKTLAMLVYTCQLLLSWLPFSPIIETTLSISQLHFGSFMNFWAVIIRQRTLTMRFVHQVLHLQTTRLVTSHPVASALLI